MKESFILYLSQYEAIKEMTNEQLGRLMRALFEKQLGNDVVLEDDIKIAFNFINNQMELDKSKYEKRCERNKANGLKGGRPKATETEQNPKKPNGYFEKPNDNDNDNENDNENDNDNVVVVDDNNVMKYYLNNINSSPVISEIQKLEVYEKEFPADLIIYAMEKAVMQKARKLAYVLSILDKWRSKGITTLSEAKDERKPTDSEDAWEIARRNLEKEGKL